MIGFSNKYILTVGTILYFLFDLIVIVLNREAFFYALHHIITIVIFIWIHTTGDSRVINSFIESTKIMEYSNITLYINFLLIYNNRKKWNSIIYKSFFVIHMINYVYHRVLLTTYNIYYNYDLIQKYFLLKISLLIYVGGIYWSILIISKLRKMK